MALPDTNPTYEVIGGLFEDGTKLGSGATKKLGFWGVTPVVQPAASAYGAIATTAPINSSISSSCFGFTSGQAAAIIALVNGLRSMGVDAGYWST